MTFILSQALLSLLYLLGEQLVLCSLFEHMCGNYSWEFVRYMYGHTANGVWIWMSSVQNVIRLFVLNINVTILQFYHTTLAIENRRGVDLVLPTDPLRSFIQSCTLPTDPLRPLLLRFEIFSGYTIHILYYAGASIMPPRVLARGLRGQLLGKVLI